MKTYESKDSPEKVKNNKIKKKKRTMVYQRISNSEILNAA